MNMPQTLNGKAVTGRNPTKLDRSTQQRQVMAERRSVHGSMKENTTRSIRLPENKAKKED
jgi:hypothetical protein